MVTRIYLEDLFPQGWDKLPRKEVDMLYTTTYNNLLQEMVGWASAAWHSNSRVKLCRYCGISSKNAARYFKECNRFWNEEESKRENAMFSPNEYCYHSLVGETIYFKHRSCAVGYIIDHRYWAPELPISL